MSPTGQERPKKITDAEINAEMLRKNPSADTSDKNARAKARDRLAHTSLRRRADEKKAQLMGDWSLGLADMLKANNKYYKLTKESMFSQDGAPNAWVKGERASDAKTNDSDQPHCKPGRKLKHSRVIKSDLDTNIDNDKQLT